jgi:hypothetical protein
MHFTEISRTYNAFSAEILKLNINNRALIIKSNNCGFICDSWF